MAGCIRTRWLLQRAMPNPHGNTATIRELDGIADEIEKNLPEASLVADHRARQVRIEAPCQIEPLLTGARAHQLDNTLQPLVERKRRRVDFQLAGLDLRKIQDLVDDRQEVLGRQIDGIDVGALLGRELGLG
jgi:DNA-directed RNA polymerase subunit K/omega